MRRAFSVYTAILIVLLVGTLFIGCTTPSHMEIIDPIIDDRDIILPPEDTPISTPEELPEPSVVEKEMQSVRIIVTSDIHGSIFPYDFIQGTPTTTSQLQIATYVEEQRAQYEAVILLDNGNVLQGQPVVYYHNFIRTDTPHIVSSMMNDMVYDASSVGKHDIAAGPEVYIRIANEVQFPYLAANMVNSVTKEPVVDPYVIIERDGLRIAVLGMIDPSIVQSLPQNLYEEILFEDMVESAQRWIAIIQQEKADMIVGLFHANLEVLEKERLKDTQLLDGFDVIFTGGDHQDTHLIVLNSLGKEVPILGTLPGARSVAAATATFAYNEELSTYELAHVTGETVMMEEYLPHPILQERYAEVVTKVTQWVSQPVGSISETISSRDAFFGDSKFIDLIHRIQLAETKADISIAAPLSFDAEIKKGEVLVRNMFSLYPNENLLYVMDLYGREIKAYMEFSYGTWFNHMKSLNDDLIYFARDTEGNLIFDPVYGSYATVTPFYNYDSFAGLNYFVDVTKPAGQRITIRTMRDGSLFDVNKTYRVAISSHRALGSGGHLAAAGISSEAAIERIIFSTEKPLRYYLMNAFETEGEIIPVVDNNWLVIPNLWVQRGIKNSYPKLFPER